jgi:hypothetical protein
MSRRHSEAAREALGVRRAAPAGWAIRLKGLAPAVIVSLMSERGAGVEALAAVWRAAI